MKMENQHNAFNGSKEVDLLSMLNRREERSKNIKDLLDYYPNSSVVSIGLNIPGPHKNSDYLQQLFAEEVNSYIEELTKEGFKILLEKRLIELQTGPEVIFVVDASAYVLKRVSVLFENSKFRRLFDIDVHYKDKDGNYQSVKREEVNAPKRKCLLCENEAKVCSSRRNHSVEDMQEKINEIINEAKGWSDERK